MKLNNIDYPLRFSNHGLERAKQRLIIENVDKNSLIYEFKLLDIVKTKACFQYMDKHKYVYRLVYNNKVYKLIINLLHNVLLIETIIEI